MKFFQILIIFFFSFKNTQVFSAKFENNIIMKIENEIITEYEVKNKILRTLFLSKQEINQKNINNLKRQTLENLIQLKLKRIELAKYKINVDPLRLNSYLSNISSNDITSLKNNFENNQISFDLFLNEIKTELKWQKLIYEIYSNKIEIDDELVDEEVSKIIRNQPNIEEYELSEIEIFLNNDATDEDRISKVKNRIQTQGFETTALNSSFSTTSSKKGYIGWVNGKSLSKEVYLAINKINPGDVTKPIIKPNSALFIKLINKKISKTKDINQAKLKENIINKKKNDLFNLYSKSHLSKLKNNSFIEYK